jgi:hypothetical protein
MAEVSYRVVVRELAAGPEAPALRRLERWPTPPPEEDRYASQRTSVGETSGSNPSCSTAESAAMKGSCRDPVAHQCPLVMTRQFVNHDERRAYANRSKISGE